jgi:CRISPR system Cascade subunit CasB
MTSTLEREKKFARYLAELNEGDDRAALAALRRGLGRAPGEAGEMHRYVVPRVQGLSRRQEDAYYIVAALYALHPGAGWSAADDGKHHKTNLGASLGRMKDESASVERRFVALLNCHRDELPQHLRQIVSLLKANDAPVDWAQLIYDINHWDSEQRFVQRNWARAFWNSDEANTNDVQFTPDEQTATN